MVKHMQAIGFGYTSDWMNKWYKIFKPILMCSDAKSITFQHSNENQSMFIYYSFKILKSDNFLATWGIFKHTSAIMFYL